MGEGSPSPITEINTRKCRRCPSAESIEDGKVIEVVDSGDELYLDDSYVRRLAHGEHKGED